MYSEYIPCCTYLWSSFRSKAANIITKSVIIARYFCALAGLPVLFLGQSRPTVIFGLIERKRPACWSFATQMRCGLEILCRWKCIEYLKNIIWIQIYVQSNPALQTSHYYGQFPLSLGTAAKPCRRIFDCSAFVVDFDFGFKYTIQPCLMWLVSYLKKETDSSQ